MQKAKGDQPRERKRLPLSLVTALLTESGYRCAVPTCRNILALDMHHVWEVTAGGPDELWNLIALCPTCHALYHRGTISRESIFAWKGMLVAIGRAFDASAIDRLMFLSMERDEHLYVSGDAVLSLGRLIAAGLVDYGRVAVRAGALDTSIFIEIASGHPIIYAVALTKKGRMLIDAWKAGDRQALRTVLAPVSPIDDGGADGPEKTDEQRA